MQVSGFRVQGIRRAFGPLAVGVQVFGVQGSGERSGFRALQFKGFERAYRVGYVKGLRRAPPRG